MASEAYTSEAVVKAIQKHNGMVSLAAKALKCSRQTIHNYATKYPEVKAAIEDAREEMTDIAESKLYAAIKKGEAWAICFYLKTQGKPRGYVERQELTGANGGALKVEWVDAITSDEDIGIGSDQLPSTG